MAVPLLDLPRDPEFAAKAGRILDLYGGRWEGELLRPGDYVVCCDQKPSIQARQRKHRTLPAAPGVKRGQLVEHEYARRGALCCFAAWDVRRAKLFDRCASTDGIVPFDALVEQFMSVKPYSKAQRVFVIVDNGSAHRGKNSIKRLQGRYENLVLVHTPVHASWLNQAEIYFSIVQRKVLIPNDFPDLDTLEQRLLGFGRRAFTLKVGDGDGWTTTKLNRPRHFTYWREPALRAVLSTSPWNAESIDHVVGLNDDWLYCICRTDSSER